MAIQRVEIKDFLVFKGEFAVEFCEGINVLIGGNGTGKTTLLRCLYDNGFVTVSSISSGSPFAYSGVGIYDSHSRSPAAISHPSRNEPGKHKQQGRDVVVTVKDKIERYTYIPEKDILEHAKGLLPFIEQKSTGFNHIYKDVLVSAQDIPTTKQTELQRSIGDILASIIGGHIEWVQSEGTFYTVRTDGMRIPFSVEASGFKKLGYLGLLIASGQIDKGTVLFWDEPENSLNPEQVPLLVEILLKLSRNGVQVFLATHSEILASYISALRKSDDKVTFFSLYNDAGKINYDKDERFDLLKPNNLIAEQAKLHEKEVERVFR